MKTFTPKGQSDLVKPIIAQYCCQHGGGFASLLTDLLHWCDHNDEDFDECLTVARQYHAQERDHADDTAGE